LDCDSFYANIDVFVLQDYDQHMLEVGYEEGNDRLLLWLPVVCKHVITDSSPLASWLKPSGVMADADSAIVVVVSPQHHTLNPEANPSCAMWTRLFFVVVKPHLTPTHECTNGHFQAWCLQNAYGNLASCKQRRVVWTGFAHHLCRHDEVLLGSHACKHCLQVEGYMYSGSQNRMRMRIFNVLDDVKRDHGFVPLVTRPAGQN
jgi:hypothetical protein